MAVLPRLPMLGSGNIRQRDINASVDKLSLDSGIVDFEFTPSIGMIARDMDRLGLDIRSFREPLQRAVRQVIIPSIRKNFEAEGRPEKWDDLSDYAVQQRGGTEHPILQRTGKLMKGAQQLNNWQFNEIGAVFSQLPESVKYGGVHQVGYGSAGSGALNKSAEDIIAGAKKAAKIFIPARPFVMYQEEDEFDIMDVFADWFEERARRVGRFT